MTATPSTAELRGWARANGLEVSDRGPVPAAVRAAWTASRRPTSGSRRPVGAAGAPEPPRDELAVLQAQAADLAERVQRLEGRPAEDLGPAGRTDEKGDTKGERKAGKKGAKAKKGKKRGR